MRTHLSVAYSADATPPADLFSTDAQFAGAGPHPDFAARAAIWREQREGLISVAEAQRRSALVGVPKPLVAVPAALKPSVRPRHSRPAPNDSRQYAPEMATTAARDDRLTPNAKSFLQVLRARCGKGRSTEFAKATLAAVMSRSARTIRRYIVDLERFGYIKTAIRKTGRGLHTGLVVTITEKTTPFYEDLKGLAAWLAETPAAIDTAFIGRVLGNHGVTKLSLKNQIHQYHPFRRFKAAKNGLVGAG
ncbi:hypothetical protein ASG62_23155 [Aureimonas sp. Leaf427]|nr:hypothetical protein ASG62_23155 [Aureimonas sp. Leaf427]